MRIGVVFPQTEIGSDPIAVRDYAQTSESLNYSHILAFDHVLGANAASFQHERRPAHRLLLPRVPPPVRRHDGLEQPGGDRCLRFELFG